ncbi:MAG TPA: nuclear transport factor 2 family protein [Cyclobacteriaceae bacterium]|nr:nuclear transport factor 2 family protein [Cyclobacteriaceae bacterium]
MNKISFFLAISALMAINGCNHKNAAANEATAESDQTDKADSVQIRSLINLYTQSVDSADTVLASKLWYLAGDLSFIHPRGHEHSWPEIKENIYDFFATTFTSRNLESFDEKITIIGDVAWTEFYWVFDATLKAGNIPIQTRGRETQIWRKTGNDWRLVHVHYSVMPAGAN